MSREQPAGMRHGSLADGAGLIGGRGSAPPSTAAAPGSDLAAGITVGSATLVVLLWLAVLAWAAGRVADLIWSHPPWSVLAYLGLVLVISAAAGVTHYRSDRTSAH